MNKEVIKKYKKEFNAWLDGAEIQVLRPYSSGYVDTEPNWAGIQCEYRVKSKPIECWLAIYENTGDVVINKTYVYDSE